MSVVIEEFVRAQPFPLDPFQLESCRSLEQGHGVLVAAPTGAGKTVVADFAVYLAQQNLDDKVFYTTPMKALSNQKFQDLVAVYGPDQVGLLTGDTSINPTARIVIMTTEVLRNMLYAESDLLVNLRFVIMDEVHYLADKFRGPVWEEVILHLPRSVILVSLSATVSNAEEFGEWLGVVRGQTDIIVSEDRPVPLFQHVYARGDLYELFEPGGEFQNPPRIHRDIQGLGRGQPRGHQGRRGFRNGGGNRTAPIQVAQVLEDHSMLPAIYFVFSRIGCDNAVRDVLFSNTVLTTPEERREIRDVIEQRTAHLSVDDLSSLGFHEWEDSLMAGVAAHHAGLIPVFKEVVEHLFRRKLVKLVFATETLALGINMPARSVVLDKLDKFNGESRVPITPGEYTQLTGRAGRRGIDVEGHSVILWRDGMNPHALGTLASRRSYPLYSSFRPTYNMAVNLIDRYGRGEARAILERSLAQFQADRAVVDLAQTVKGNQDSLREYAEAMSCHLGDFRDYSRIRRELTDLEGKSIRGTHTPHTLQKKRADQIEKLRGKMRKHPCHTCPDREKHARWGERFWKLQSQTDRMANQIKSKTGAIASIFDRVCRILERNGYLIPADDDYTLTAAGVSLQRIYGERDLLVAECLRRGLWDGLDGPMLAAVLSTAIYEARRDDDIDMQRRIPKGDFLAITTAMEHVWDDINNAEADENLEVTPPLAYGLALGIQRWAKGQRLDDVLKECNLAGGDFVRWAKQVIDSLDQIAHVAPPALADVARAAIPTIRRGIVADSATL
ncbi:MAG: DEAD/DEAH box helicase [Microbacteriaceae bacterium]